MSWISPELERRFFQGEQTLHHQTGVYNGVASDQFIESTWMRKGKSQTGIIGNSQQPQTMATWVHSMNAATTLVNDLRNMSRDAHDVQMSHKEEAKSRIERDSRDRTSLREILT